jgi:hypothetical protein
MQLEERYIYNKHKVVVKSFLKRALNLSVLRSRAAEIMKLLG